MPGPRRLTPGKGLGWEYARNSQNVNLSVKSYRKRLTQRRPIDADIPQVCGFYRHIVKRKLPLPFSFCWRKLGMMLAAGPPQPARAASRFGEFSFPRGRRPLPGLGLQVFDPLPAFGRHFLARAVGFAVAVAAQGYEIHQPVCAAVAEGADVVNFARWLPAPAALPAVAGKRPLPQRRPFPPAAPTHATFSHLVAEGGLYSAAAPVAITALASASIFPRPR